MRTLTLADGRTINLYDEGTETEEIKIVAPAVQKQRKPGSGRPRKTFNVEKAMDLRQRGISFRGIAKQCGVSYRTVARRLPKEQTDL